MTTITALCTMRFTEEQLARLKAASSRLRVIQETCHNAEEVAAALADHPDTEVLYTFDLPANALALALDLRWVQLHSAGADHLLQHSLMQSDVLITTTSGIHATPIAEYVFASILAYRWRVPLWTRCQHEGEWPAGRWNLYARPELRDSTLGIVGYGSIGREVGRLGQTFGMRVLALRRSPGRAEEGYAVGPTGDPDGAIPDRFYQPEDLCEMLAECEYVVIALPSTPDTYHTIGEAELRAMRPTAYLINIARGALVDEVALIRALKDGWIGGAGLDVFEQEPLPSDSPLWSLENVLISPHVAGYTPRYDERAVALFAQNLARYCAGEPVLNLVDKARGVLMAIKCVIFDLGHTLMHLDGTWPEVFAQGRADLQAFLRTQELDLDAEAFGRTLLERRSEGFARARATLREVTAEQTMRWTFAHFRLPDPAPELLAGAIDAFFAYEFDHWFADPEALPLLEALAGHGFKLGMYSNATDDRFIQRLVGRFGFRPWLEPALSSAGTGIRKPDPAAFAPILGAWGLEPGSVAMVGDTLDADILGANRAGMWGVWIRSRNDARQEGTAAAPETPGAPTPDATIDRLAELPEALVRLQ